MWVQIEAESGGTLRPERLPGLLTEAFQGVNGDRPVQVWVSRARSGELDERGKVLTQIRELSLDEEKFLICPLPSSKGGRVQFSEVELHYLLMFYLSNIARYQPHLWGEILIGRKTAETLLVRNFIESSEKKFPCLVHTQIFRKILLG